MQSHSDTKPIDLVALANNYGAHNIERLLQLFLDDSGKEIESIKIAADKLDMPRLLASAHGLKGICANLFVERMRRICFSLESAGKQKDFQYLPELVRQLETEFESIKQFLESNAAAAL